ncbi:MAG: carbohydrate ABC transporter permease [Geminicoccaceae bacterium]
MNQPLTTVGDRAVRYWLIAPAVFVILLIGLYPLIQLFATSVQNITMFEEDRSFQGFVHYARLWNDDRLWQAIGHTALITLIALPLELILGLAMAFLFLEDLPLKRVLVALLVLPTVIAPIVAGSIWRLVLDHRFGPMNQVLGWIAGREVKLLWTIEPHLVWPAILMAEGWQWTPFMFLILLAALANVDREQLEAAEIDGASWWLTFRKLVLPAIWPVMAVALLIRGLDLVRVFDVIWTMTQGGPGTATETISIYAYQMAFREFEVSYSAAIALLVILSLTALLLLMLRRLELQR